MVEQETTTGRPWRLGGRVVGALAGAAIVAVAVLYFVDFDSPRLGAALLERAGAATGAKITARRFRFGLLRGVMLEGVEASGALSGGRYQVSLDRLVFVHRLLPLLWGRVAIARIVLERPQLRLSETGGAAPAARGAAVAAPPALGLDISEIAVRQGTVEVKARGGPATTTLAGLELRLRDLSLDPRAGAALTGLSAQGQIQVERIGLGPTRVRETQGRVRIVQGRLETEGVRFTTDEGRFEARLEARLDRLPLTYALTLRGDPLDVNAMAGAGQSGGFGAGRLELRGSGAGTEPAGLTAAGSLNLAAGKIGATPTLTALEALLGRTHVVGTRYRASETPFRIQAGRVSFDAFRLETETVRLEATGWVGLDGPMDVHLTARVPRKDVDLAGVSPQALDALTDDQGRVSIPFKVGGTREHPRVLPDVAALVAQAGRGGAKALLKKKLGGLLGETPH